MPKKPTTEDLLDGQPIGWVVVPIYAHQTKADREAKRPKVLKRYELQFEGVTQQKAHGAVQTDKLHKVCDFLNKRKLTPRERIQCAADAPNPEAHLKNNTP